MTEPIAVGSWFKRKHLTVMPEGFRIRAGGKTDDWRDDQVASVSLLVKRRQGGGVLKALARRIRLDFVTGGAPLEFQQVWKMSDDDPVGAWLDRLLDGLASRAEEAIASGRSALGEGWKLGDQSLQVEGERATVIPLSELGAVGWYDEQFCVWRRHDEEPTARFPGEAANVHLLSRLLGPRVVEPDASEPPPAGMGRVLFERRASARTVALTRWAGFLLVAGGLAGVVVAEHELRLVGAGAAALGALCVFAAWWMGKAAFRCHEWGVAKTRPGKSASLRYDQVDSFTFSAIRQFTNGIYTGTHLSLAFKPLPVASLSRITWSANMQLIDDDIEELRDHISRVIASRLRGELAEGRPVTWTPALRLLPEGLEFKPRGLFGGAKETRLLGYGLIQGTDLQDGTLHVWVAGNEKSIVQESTAAENFFPGLYAFASLLAPDESEQAPAHPAADED